jgi:hypothetical protein
LYLKFSVYDDAIDLLVEVLDEKEERRAKNTAEETKPAALAEWLPYTRLEQLEQQIQAVVTDADSPLSAAERNRLINSQKHLQWKLSHYLQRVEERTVALKQEVLSS